MGPHYAEIRRGTADTFRDRLGKERLEAPAGLVAAGLGNREIAGVHFLPERTVDSHIEHLFAKLGFTSRTQLAGGSWRKKSTSR